MQTALAFPEDEEMAKRAVKLDAKAVFKPCVFQTNALNTYKFTQDLMPHLVHTYGNFEDKSWFNAFKNKEIAYKPLLVEIFASFSLNEGESRDPDFNTKLSIRFRLRGTYHDLSLKQFGCYLGLYEGSSSDAAYIEHLNASSLDAPPGYNILGFWDKIAMVEYDGGKFRESNLCTPVFRMLHRFLGWTVMFMNDVRKLNQDQLIGLHYLVHRKNRFHLPLAFARLFVKASSDDTRSLYCGQFITRIAMVCGALTTRIRKELGNGILPNIQGEKFMLRSFILKRNEQNVVVPYEKDEHKSGQDTRTGKRKRSGGKGSSTSISRPTTRMMYEAVNQLRFYNDEIVCFMANVDKRAHWRYVNPDPTSARPNWYKDEMEIPAAWTTRIRPSDSDVEVDPEMEEDNGEYMDE